MCGITGIYGFEDKHLITKMTSTLKHRGPDQYGYFNDKNISLGHRRLSILDLTKRGKQPMSNEDNSIFITFNGEIYNHLEIRKELEKKGHIYFSNTDTETVIHAYEEYGFDCLKLFNGCFAFALYDSNKKIIFLARDRLGIKPLYYTFYNNNLLFASEIKAILKFKEIKKELNLQALNSYLTYFANIDSETIFKGIYKLKPAHYLIYDGKNKIVKKYWSLKLETEKKPLSYFIKKLRNNLKRAVDLRLMGEVPLCVYLSGGIDSSTIVALLHMSKANIKTFSISFGYDEQKKEIDNAKRVSEFFKTDHSIIEVTPKTIKLLPEIIYYQDEPMADPTSIPTYILSKFTKKKGYTIALTGEGSDEIFCGYEQYKFIYLYNKYLKFIPKPIKLTLPFLLKSLPKPFLNKLFKYSEALGEKAFERFKKFLTSPIPSKAYLEIISIFDEDEKKEIMKNVVFNYNLEEWINKNFFIKKRDILTNLMNLELKTTLVENLLMKVDKNTMANAVEARVPFLDHTVVEDAFKIPSSYKLRHFVDKYILRKAMSDLLPKENVWAKKERFFVPINIWLDQDLRDYIKQIFDKKTFAKFKFFNTRYIDKIKKDLNKSKLFYTRQLWTLLNFYIWYKIYIEEEKIS